MSKMLMPTVLLSVMAVVMVFGSASHVLADSDGEAKSYKRHWAIPIGDASGSLEITPDTDKAELEKSVLPLEIAAAEYSDIHKAKLGKAVNDEGRYFLVWNLVSYGHDTESDTKFKTIYVLDAGTGEPLADPITKEGGGSCGDKDKPQTKRTGANA